MTETLTKPSRVESNNIGLRPKRWRAGAYGFIKSLEYPELSKGNFMDQRTKSYPFRSLRRSLITTPTEETKKRFKRLAQQWKEETWHCSSIYKITMHSAYQKIMAMGPDAIPLILQDLSRETNFWFWALRNMAGEDPVPKEARGKTEEMAKAWLEWGMKKGYEF